MSNFFSKFICGDAISEMKQLKRNKIRVDAIITDPPYNISQKNNFSTLKSPRKGLDFGEWDKDFDQLKWIKHIDPILKNGGSIIIFNTWRNLGIIANELEKNGFLIKDLIRWIKTNPMPKNMDRRYVSDYEFAIWAVKQGKNWIFNKNKSGYLVPEIKTSTVSGNERTKHPTQKSLELMKRLIEVHTNVGDTILDPFAGSATTLLACKQTNRQYIGIEKNKDYFEIGANRLK